MRLDDRRIEQDVEAIVEQGRQIRPAPDVVRARLLARARAAFAASAASPAPIPALSTRTVWRARRIAVAASLLLVFATAAAAAVFHAVAARPPALAPTAPRVSDPPTSRRWAGDSPAREAPQPASNSGAKRPHPAITPRAVTARALALRALTPRESYAAELRLLQRAQSQYAGHDFASALVLLAEHGRRFPSGRLAEEREALRVQLLARAGRGDEARRALASFADRFPRSAFLPRLQAAAGSADK